MCTTIHTTPYPGPKYMNPKWREKLSTAGCQLHGSIEELNRKFADDWPYIINVAELLYAVAGEIETIAYMDPNNITNMGGRRRGLKKRTQGYITRIAKIANNFQYEAFTLRSVPRYNDIYGRMYHQELACLVHLIKQLICDLEDDWHINGPWELVEPVDPEEVFTKYEEKWLD